MHSEGKVRRKRTFAVNFAFVLWTRSFIHYIQYQPQWIVTNFLTLSVFIFRIFIEIVRIKYIASTRAYVRSRKRNGDWAIALGGVTRLMPLAPPLFQLLPPPPRLREFFPLTRLLTFSIENFRQSPVIDVFFLRNYFNYWTRMSLALNRLAEERKAWRKVRPNKPPLAFPPPDISAECCPFDLSRIIHLDLWQSLRRMPMVRPICGSGIVWFQVCSGKIENDQATECWVGQKSSAVLCFSRPER